MLFLEHFFTYCTLFKTNGFIFQLLASPYLMCSKKLLDKEWSL